MACLDNVKITQNVTYANIADDVNGILTGNIELSIENFDALPIEGEIIVDNIRDTDADLNAEPISITNSFTSATSNFNYNFYYPTSNPDSITISVSVSVRIGTCLYNINCSHVLYVPNDTGEVSSCEEFPIGVDIVLGCTDPRYYEYNPNANYDNGTCETLIPILGCTNVNASNYSPNATQNDGSCVFLSGCTDSSADNYDVNAVIDDGSCMCNDVFLEISPFSSGETVILRETCEYFFEYDLMVNLKCDKLLEKVADGEFLIDILNNHKVKFQVHTAIDNNGGFLNYTGGTFDLSGVDFILTQEEEIITFDVNSDTYPFGLVEDPQACKDLTDLLALELGLDCNEFDKNKFLSKWNTYSTVLNSDLTGTYNRFILKFEGFKGGLEGFIDNIKINEVCTEEKKRCVNVPQKFGFEIEKILDNKKSWVYSDIEIKREFENTEYIEEDNRLIFNTKLLELHINPNKYIENDVIDYYNTFEDCLEIENAEEIDFESISLETLKTSSVDVNSRQIIYSYPFLSSVYDLYSISSGCKQSKRLNYEYGLNVIDKAGKEWYETLKLFVPATSIWDGNQFVLKNYIFHQQKHKYKKYSLTQGGDEGFCDLTGITVECNDVRESCTFVSPLSIDELLVSGTSDLVCTFTGDSVCVSNYNERSEFSGKLLQYFDGTGDTINVIDTIGLDSYDCVSGSTDNGNGGGGGNNDIFGCTNPLALNYNPIANVDDGSCVFEDLSLIVNTICNEDNTTATVNLIISGGAPPYNTIGLTNGQILANGENYSVFVVDSVGNISNTVNGTVACPPIPCEGVIVSLDVEIECEEDFNGYNTGNGELKLDASDGTPPYTFVNLNTAMMVQDGDIFPDGTNLNIVALDADGCQSAETQIMVDCPTPDCEDINLELDLTITTDAILSLYISRFEIEWQLNGLPSAIGLDTIEFEIDVDPPRVLFFGNFTSNQTNGSEKFNIDYFPNLVAKANIDIEVTITLENGCVYTGSVNDIEVKGANVGDSQDITINF